MLNLLTDRCFPVLRQDGREDTIPLHQIAETRNSVTQFLTPRHDFDGALVQLAIGVLQTLFAPPDEDTWLQRFANPPDPDELQAVFAKAAPFFELLGDGVRFMQDLELEPTPSEAKGIGTLLIEAPGGNTLKNNIDHFVKRGTVRQLGPFFTAVALYCLQTNAPSGGAGHRVGLRGGGPLTTVIWRPTLWQTLWLGVLVRDDLLAGHPDAHRQWELEDCFPWARPTRDSKKKGSEIHAVSCHPAVHYWGMPRRIRLCDPDRDGGICDLEGRHRSALFRDYVTKNYGNNYGEGWHHPLTPHYLDKADQVLPLHGQPGSLSYHHWLGLAFSDCEQGKERRLPARIVSRYGNRVRYLERITRESDMREPRLWVFGYDMDNAKARAWIDRTMPVLLAHADDIDQREHYRAHIQGMIQAARNVCQTLRAQVKSAFKGPIKARGDWSHLDLTFWNETEADFLALVAQLAHDPDAVEPRETWLRQLQRKALVCFESHTADRAVEVVDPARVARAYNQLVKFTSPRGKRLRAMLDLPPAPTKREETTA